MPFKILQNTARILWRIWFVILASVPILLMLPLLFIFCLSEKGYPYFYRCARVWGSIILYGMGLIPSLNAPPNLPKGSYVLVGNHTSVIDIMLMLWLFPKHPFVFVGKKELGRLPIFGFFYKRTCIMVDRSDAKSRSGVYSRAAQRLQQGLSICIFPEGGVPDDESVVLDTFKDGAFKLAIDFQIPVVTVSILDAKKRYPFRWLAGQPGRVRLKVHPPICTQSYTLQDRKLLSEKVRTLLLNDLNSH